MDFNLLEELSLVFGPSGFEGDAQKIVRKYGEKYADEIIFDRLGSIAFKMGSSGPKLMFSAHIDEVGFLVSKIEDNGTLRIGKIGYPIEHFYPSHEIMVKSIKNEKSYIGLIETKPYFPNTEFSNELKIHKYWVDIGCESPEDVKELGIQVGDPIIPLANFRLLDLPGKRRAIARNFDDRIGAFILLEVMKYLVENDLKLNSEIYFVSSVQEEVGSRGASTIANMIHPDVEFAIDIIPSNDLPNYDHLPKQSLGNGTIIQSYDAFLIPNPKLRKWVMSVAEHASIKWQLGYSSGGGTDASTIHTSNIGVPSLNLGIPLRYYHSHHSLVDFADVEHTEKLIIEICRHFDQSLLNDFIML